MMPDRNEFQLVSLTLEAAVRFPDIGTRHGAEGETWLPGADLVNVT
jgi:hypothetical protein